MECQKIVRAISTAKRIPYRDLRSKNLVKITQYSGYFYHFKEERFYFSKLKKVPFSLHSLLIQKLLKRFGFWKEHSKFFQTSSRCFSSSPRFGSNSEDEVRCFWGLSPIDPHKISKNSPNLDWMFLKILIFRRTHNFLLKLKKKFEGS